MSSESGHPDAFPTTRWTLIARAGAPDSVSRGKALTEICKVYWQPIYAFLCARGHTPHDAEDFTQGFFAQFLKKDHFSGLEPEKGRLRSYLLASLKRYMVDEFRRENRLKRGGDAQVISIEAAKLECVALVMGDSNGLEPDRLYDRIWAIKVLETAYESLERKYRGRGREAVFAKLCPLIRAETGVFDYDTVALELGVSPAALRVAVHRFRQRYGNCIREVVSHTLGDGADTEEEIRYLMSVFS